MRNIRAFLNKICSKNKKIVSINSILFDLPIVKDKKYLYAYNKGEFLL